MDTPTTCTDGERKKHILLISVVGPAVQVQIPDMQLSLSYPSGSSSVGPVVKMGTLGIILLEPTPQAFKGWEESAEVLQLYSVSPILAMPCFVYIICLISG